MLRKLLVATCVLAVAAANGAYAKEDWQKVAELKAGGAAKEVSVDKKISRVRIECTGGSVGINTVVVREGSRKTPMPVTTHIDAGTDKVIDLDKTVAVSGLRISDNGKGTYTVSVR